MNRSEDFDSNTTSEEESSPKKPKKNMEKQIKKEEMGEIRSHHVRTRCRMPGCKALVCDIKRHLKVRVKRGELDADDLDGHCEIMRHGKQKFRQSAGKPEIRGKKRRKNGALYLTVKPSVRS